MSGRLLVCASAFALTACSAQSGPEADPALAPRGTTMTTAKPTRQDLSNKVSLTGTVSMDPVFGLTAPVAGQIRYWDVPKANGTPTYATRAATVWVDDVPYYVDVPAGSTFEGRLVADRSTVTAGMPIVSARYSGYALVGVVGSAQAYKLTEGQPKVQAQVKNGPGPFACAPLGTIAALPAGTVPVPTPDKKDEKKDEDAPAATTTAQEPQGQTGSTGSEATGLRLICTPPADVRMVNGAEATLEVVTATVQNALVVPVEAVAGGQGKGKVDVLDPNGVRQTRDVVLGLTDGKVVEVKSGLTGEETLAVPGPNLPAGAEPKQDGPGK
ncbi:efflux RND transporter periplasmic adaptor subunit [Actinosynnema sp. NPDC020468]|uniref:efflux RND transporter periplasmic adaptor subunit n=1 Tax=Actinosynnema sp. NPDC020468 TaxID=3154488 RepID=UPI0033E333E0